MPGYGVAGPDEGRGLLPWSWAEERIAGGERYWLTTVAPDGAPHVMPVWAVWLDARLWLSTGGRSRKARNLRGERRCAVHVDGDVVREPAGVARRDLDAAGGDRHPLRKDPVLVQAQADGMPARGHVRGVVPAPGQRSGAGGQDHEEGGTATAHRTHMMPA